MRLHSPMLTITAHHPCRWIWRLAIPQQSTGKILRRQRWYSIDVSRALVFSLFQCGLHQANLHPQSQAAVVRGAVLRGLEGTAPTIKQCRYHYGFDWNMEFRPGIDMEKNAYIDLSGKKYVSGVMDWFIKKVGISSS